MVSISPIRRAQLDRSTEELRDLLLRLRYRDEASAVACPAATNRLLVAQIDVLWHRISLLNCFDTHKDYPDHTGLQFSTWKGSFSGSRYVLEPLSALCGALKPYLEDQYIIIVKDVSCLIYDSSAPRSAY